MLTWAEYVDPDRPPPSRAVNLLMTALGYAGAFGLTYCFWWAFWRIVFAVSG